MILSATAFVGLFFFLTFNTSLLGMEKSLPLQVSSSLKSSLLLLLPSRSPASSTPQLPIGLLSPHSIPSCSPGPLDESASQKVECGPTKLDVCVAWLVYLRQHSGDKRTPAAAEKLLMRLGDLGFAGENSIAFNRAWQQEMPDAVAPAYYVFGDNKGLSSDQSKKLPPRLLSPISTVWKQPVVQEDLFCLEYAVATQMGSRQEDVCSKVCTFWSSQRSQDMRTLVQAQRDVKGGVLKQSDVESLVRILKIPYTASLTGWIELKRDPGGISPGRLCSMGSHHYEFMGEKDAKGRVVSAVARGDRDKWIREWEGAAGVKRKWWDEEQASKDNEDSLASAIGLKKTRIAEFSKDQDSSGLPEEFHNNPVLYPGDVDLVRRILAASATSAQ